MTYQEEQNKVLKFILNNTFFNNFQKEKCSNGSVGGLELIITPECNLNCSYCYIHQHGESLYPTEIRNHNTILENLDKILDFFEEKNLYVHELSLFSGEIWASSFGLEVLDRIYQHYSKRSLSNVICLPSNMSFLQNDIATQKIEAYIDKFKQAGTTFYFSASIDGAIIEDLFRPFKNTQKHNDNFYDKVFSFAKRHPETGFHPMVSSKSCKYWIENYQWFREQFEKYDLHQKDALAAPMMLEVRNPDWTDEDIQAWKDFAQFLFDEIRSRTENIEEFSQFLFRYGKYKNMTYSPISLIDQGTQFSCGVQKRLHVRLGDLAIVICHRLSYNNLLLGHFTVNNEGKIDDVVAHNPELMLYIKTVNPKTGTLYCEKCAYKGLCMKGCCGAQYEATQVLNLPIDNVCHFLKEKTNFLLDLYANAGILTQLQKDCQTNPDLIRTYNDVIEIQHYREGQAV